MKHTIQFIFMLLVFASNFANTKMISGTIIDATSKEGILDVHIYSLKFGQGTITNADGNFYLISSEKDKLSISCIGYETQIIYVDKNDFENGLKIQLQIESEILNEIVLNSKPITAEIILEKVFKNFKKNHAVEPVYYNFYNRVVSHEKDSTLKHIEEYTGIIKQNWLHNTKYNIEKGRIKYLTKDSLKKLKNHRVISMNKMFIDNIYRFRDDYIHPRKSKRYQYKILGKSNLFDRNCYVLSFYTEENTYYKKGELYIDIEDFAIARKLLVNDKNDRVLTDTSFKKEGAKWYLKKTEEYHNSFDTPTVTDYRITLYNYLNNKDSNLKFIKLSVGFSSKHTSNFNDNFWKNINFIPLPNWIKKQI